MRFDPNQAFKKRAVIGLCIMGAFMLLLLLRMGALQIWDHQKYTTLSKRNQLRLIPIPAERGLIYDRHGNLLAKNVPAYYLALVPDQVDDLPATLNALSKIVPLPEEKRTRFLEQITLKPKHQRQVLPVDLSEEDISRFAVQLYRFPGVNIMVDMQREYPYGSLFAHVIGYVGEMTKEELKQHSKTQNINPLQIGKTGLEKQYDLSFQGQPGFQHVETDAMGREIRTLYTHPSVPGQDLHLTLDLRLQQIALRALGQNNGVIIALNPKNGEILAMVNAPSYDPNIFVKGIDNITYQKLMHAPERPLFHRAIQGQYPPASTIKPTVALAGLMNDKIQPKERIFDPGWFQLHEAGRLYRDTPSTGHGMTDLEKAIRVSCDTYFYAAADKIGIQQLSHWYQQVGLGRATGIDLPGEQKGIVPSAAWKRKTIGESWYPGETVITGIGQGYTLATPLQLAVMGSYFANRGDAYKPHLSLSKTPEKLPHLNVPPNYWQMIIEPMRQVTQHEQGTAYRYFKDTTLNVAGKTGTAQVFGLKANERYYHDKVAKHLRDHSLFIGFAPANDPEIVIVVLLEHERFSGGIAKLVLEEYFNLNKEPEQANYALSTTRP